MKQKELHRKLSKAGWYLVHGGKHDKYVHKDHEQSLTVPRHKELPEPLARQILKDAGLL
ncbi:MAG: type II toxin-antitoxin system HicA family toxin [Ruminococcus sp.]|nr:type II toxin-antitoxin system HicA family toxin [Ruminococcus sp.]